MSTLSHLFENNRIWAEEILARQPDFFQKLSLQQIPQYLWIGCSDSRVPANEIVNLLPGELFVHRNVANVVVHTDLNCLSVLQYAVEALKVKHVIVCGHYGCGGVKAAMNNSKLGLIDNWLRHIQDVMEKYEAKLAPNVIEQAANVCQTTVVQSAWDRGQELTVHGWIYRIEDGLLHDLSFSVENQQEFLSSYQKIKKK
jgi:carbonic anhydrase